MTWSSTVAVILVICLVTGYVFFFYIQATAPNEKELYAMSEISLEDMKKRMKPGDILFLSGISATDLSIRWFGDSCVTHSMIVANDEEDLLEADVDRSGSTVKVVSLDDKIERIKTSHSRLPVIVYLPCRTKLRVDTEKYVGKEYDWSYLRWIGYVFGYGSKQDKYVCSTLVSSVMQDNGIYITSQVPGGQMRELEGSLLYESPLRVKLFGEEA